MERVVKKGNIEIFTESFGHAQHPALLLLMGAGASMIWWDAEFCRKLAGSGFFVIRYDHRDMGRSTCSAPFQPDYDVLDMADDALNILDDYQIGKAHLVGMSLGGMLAQIIAIRHPERVLSLTLIASGVWDDLPELPPVDQRLIDYHSSVANLDWENREALVDYMVEGWWLLNGSRHPFDEKQARMLAFAEVERANNLSCMLNHSLIQGGESLYGRAKEIETPALIIHGTEDIVLPFAHAEALHRTLPHSRLTPLAGAGHEIHRLDWGLYDRRNNPVYRATEQPKIEIKLIKTIVTMTDKKKDTTTASPEKETFHISYTHDDYNGHYVHGGKFDVNREQLVRFLDILKKHFNDHPLEDDDKTYISGIEEWRNFFFHPFGFMAYASSYEIRIYTPEEKFYLAGEDPGTIDKIRSSLQDKGETKTRCGWCGNDPLYVKYHDEEWGREVTGDEKMFEFLTLESAQAGLSWITILRRRDGYRQAFADFNARQVAGFSEQDVERLMQDTGIIRNRLKIKAAISNAQHFLKIQEEYGSFCSYLKSFLPDGKPVVNHWKTLSELPASTPLSDAISKDMKKRGFKFFGTTICYAHLQATGLVNDHLIPCFCRQETVK